VIPKIISVVSPHPNPLPRGEGEKQRGKKIIPPQKCPSCGVVVVKDENKVRYYCPNRNSCPAQISEKLVFAV
jgi:NAD-dependent DNA ligase